MCSYFDEHEHYYRFLGFRLLQRDVILFLPKLHDRESEDLRAIGGKRRRFRGDDANFERRGKDSDGQDKEIEAEKPDDNSRLVQKGVPVKSFGESFVCEHVSEILDEFFNSGCGKRSEKRTAWNKR